MSCKIGEKFNRWTIIDIAPSRNNSKYWLCRCDCGTVKEVCQSSLKRGTSKSCGCINKERKGNTFKDETGKTYGRLTVVELDKNKNHDNRAYWICKCSCGNFCSVVGKDLRNGHTKSCGCLQKEKIRQQRYDLSKIKIGDKFGQLTVIQQEKDKKYGKTSERQWLCKCDCGNTIILTTHALKSRNTSSCGCLISKGEQKIKKILQENNITFKTQFTFSDCIANIAPCKFDFCIIKNNKLHCLIEYQGIQHFDINNPWYIQTDQIKRNYCQENNIKLIEIPYTDYLLLNWEYLKEKCEL